MSDYRAGDSPEADEYRVQNRLMSANERRLKALRLAKETPFNKTGEPVDLDIYKMLVAKRYSLAGDESVRAIRQKYSDMDEQRSRKSPTRPDVTNDSIPRKGDK